LNGSYIETDAAIQLPARNLILHDTSTSSSSIAQLAIANGESNENGLSVGDHSVSIPMISNRVTTLSTMESVENNARRPQALTPELDITEIEGCGHITGAVGHQGADPEMMR
jgi:hypothetical protein